MVVEAVVMCSAQGKGRNTANGIFQQTQTLRRDRSLVHGRFEAFHWLINGLEQLRPSTARSRTAVVGRKRGFTT